MIVQSHFFNSGEGFASIASGSTQRDGDGNGWHVEGEPRGIAGQDGPGRGRQRRRVGSTCPVKHDFL